MLAVAATQFLVVLAVAFVVGAPAQADRAAGDRPLTIKVQGVANSTQTRGGGTWSASGAFSDRGKFTVRRNPSTFRDLWRLSGVHGTVSVSAFANHWTIVSGTGAYVRLHGKGTSKE